MAAACSVATRSLGLRRGSARSAALLWSPRRRVHHDGQVCLAGCEHCANVRNTHAAGFAAVGEAPEVFEVADARVGELLQLGEGDVGADAAVDGQGEVPKDQIGKAPTRIFPDSPRERPLLPIRDITGIGGL